MKTKEMAPMVRLWSLTLLAMLGLVVPVATRADGGYSFSGVVDRAPPVGAQAAIYPLGMTVERDDVERDGNGDIVRRKQWVDLRGVQICWHLDRDRFLPPSELRRGTLVRIFSTHWDVERVEVVSLGPYELEASLEDWICEASGNRPEKALSPGQLAMIAALGSESYFVRTAVTEAMERRGMAMLRPLIWARHSRDPEIVARAELLLSKLGWEP